MRACAYWYAPHSLHTTHGGPFFLFFFFSYVYASLSLSLSLYQQESGMRQAFLTFFSKLATRPFAMEALPCNTLAQLVLMSLHSDIFVEDFLETSLRVCGRSMSADLSMENAARLLVALSSADQHCHRSPQLIKALTKALEVRYPWSLC